MKDYIILTDATVDLPADVVEELGIRVLPMEFEIDGQAYKHYPDEREMPITEFYEKLKLGKMPTTAQVSPYIYSQAFEECLKEGKDIVCIVFSSGLSGTYQSANIAREDALQEYPDRQIFCIDSKCASVGEGVLVYNAALKAKSGLSAEELALWVENNKYNAGHWFTVEDLIHLNRGGRLSSIEAVVGTALKIKPILSVDRKGKLVVRSKVRGSKKALNYLVDRLKENGINAKEQTVFVGHANNIEQAKNLRDMIIEQKLAKDVIITSIGPIIGSHVGPGMFALTFMGTETKE